jgi:hypothetical protein
MAIEEVATFRGDLGTFLRRSLSGYVYVLLTGPLWLRYLSVLTHDFGVALALLVIAGIVAGSIIYELWHLAFWYLSWHSERCLGFWGLNHIQTLRQILPDDRFHDPQRRAVWDAVFFRSKDEVQKRILNLFSSAHGSATTGIAIVLSAISWWSCVRFGGGLDFVFFIGVSVAVFLFAYDHLRLCRDAGALESLFLGERQNQTRGIGRVFSGDPPQVTG